MDGFNLSSAAASKCFSFAPSIGTSGGKWTNGTPNYGVVASME